MFFPGGFQLVVGQFWISGRSRNRRPDRKSTRLNSSHGYISYAVFCLKKKKTAELRTTPSSRSLRMLCFCGEERYDSTAPTITTDSLWYTCVICELTMSVRTLREQYRVLEYKHAQPYPLHAEQLSGKTHAHS